MASAQNEITALKARNVVLARKRKGWSQIKLGKAIGKSKTAASIASANWSSSHRAFKWVACLANTAQTRSIWPGRRTLGGRTVASGRSRWPWPLGIGGTGRRRPRSSRRKKAPGRSRGRSTSRDYPTLRSSACGRVAQPARVCSAAGPGCAGSVGAGQRRRAYVPSITVLCTAW